MRIWQLCSYLQIKEQGGPGILVSHRIDCELILLKNPHGLPFSEYLSFVTTFARSISIDIAFRSIFFSNVFPQIFDLFVNILAKKTPYFSKFYFCIEANFCQNSNENLVLKLLVPHCRHFLSAYGTFIITFFLLVIGQEKLFVAHLFTRKHRVAV